MMTKTQQVIAGLVASMEKQAMHGYPDYQMTEPQTPPVPQMTLPSYEPEDPAQQQERGLLSGPVPWRWGAGGAMAGAFGGKSFVDNTLKSEEQVLQFLKGRGGAGPVATGKILKYVEQGKVLPEDVGLLREIVSDPERIKTEFYSSPAAWSRELKEHRKAYWRAMGKGPGLGALGGAAVGLGAGYALQHFFDKESAHHEPGVLGREEGVLSRIR